MKIKVQRKTQHIKGINQQVLIVTLERDKQPIAKASYAVESGQPRCMTFQCPPDQKPEFVRQVRDAVLGHAGRMAGIQGARSGKSSDKCFNTIQGRALLEGISVEEAEELYGREQEPWWYD